jgi:hypothetical protein
MVVLEAFLCLEPRETRWSGLGNQTVWFGDCCGLVSASVLFPTFSLGTLFCTAATSFGPFSVLGFTSSLAEVLLLGPICPLIH